MRGEEADKDARQGQRRPERRTQARPRGPFRPERRTRRKYSNRPAALGRLGARDVRARLGGATAYPKAKGIWRDDERGGALVKDEPVIVHCYTTPADIEDDRNLAELRSFCRKMGIDARQGEVGLVIGDEYFGIRDFEKE